MAKKQSRRCISVNRKVYEAAKLFAANRGMPLSKLVEEALGIVMQLQPIEKKGEDNGRATVEV